MEIRLRLYKSQILKSVKDETFLSGRVELATDGSNSERVYNLQAGDEELHESKLLRSLRIGLDDLKSKLTNFVKNEGDPCGDNISDTLNGECDYFDIVLNVSSRFNLGYVQTLTTLSSSYLEEYCTALWWTTVNPSLATNYYNSASNIFMSIRRCFIKIPPKKPIMCYPKSVTATFSAESFHTVGDLIDLDYQLTYESNNGCDDICAKSSNEEYIHITFEDNKYKGVLLNDIPVGISVCITLYSKHDPGVSTVVEIIGKDKGNG